MEIGEYTIYIIGLGGWAPCVRMPFLVLLSNCQAGKLIHMGWIDISLSSYLCYLC